MSAAGYFTEDEIRNAIIGAGYEIPGASPAQPEQVTGIIGAQLKQDRDDGPKGDFGLFGNLLKDTEKTFTKNVYTEIGPGKFDFVPTEIKGYKNVNTGNYQTEAGKNINHLGLEVPTIAGMLFDKNFGKGPQVGDIEGTFTKGIPTNNIKNPFAMFQKQQTTENIKKGDVLLMEGPDKKLSHVALYLGDQLILHHEAKKLSCRELYNLDYIEVTKEVYRYAA